MNNNETGKISCDVFGNAWYDDRFCWKCGHALEVKYPDECSICCAPQSEEGKKLREEQDID